MQSALQHKKMALHFFTKLILFELTIKMNLRKLNRLPTTFQWLNCAGNSMQLCGLESIIGNYVNLPKDINNFLITLAPSSVI